MAQGQESSSDESKPVSAVTRVLGLIGGIVVGAVVGALAMAGATLLAEWQSYAGFVPSPTQGGFGGGAIGLVLGILFPEKSAYVFVWFITS